MGAEDKLKKLQERKAELDAKIRSIKRKQSQAERRADTRRKILVGAMLLGMREKQSPEWWDKWEKALDGFLTEDRDRALFDLKPRDRKSQTMNPSSGEEEKADF